MKSIKWKRLAMLSASALLLFACEGQDAGDPDDDDTEVVDDNGEDDNGDDNGSDDVVVDEPTLEPVDADIPEGFSIAMVTDEGGVDDLSFNQSAWEGMVEWEEVNGLDNAVEYFESNDAADFVPNFQSAVADGYDITYGIGFLLEDAVNDTADQYPDLYFGLVDAVSERTNVVSITFADHEAAFLAGIAAAMTTETNQIGFLGGIPGPVIDRFQTGFEAGVAYVNEDIVVDVQYGNAFDDPTGGQQIGAGMFESGIDVIYQAAGATGLGVFTEATNRMDAGSDVDLWVVGVDRDQHDEGEYDGGNVTLTSTLKEVGMSIALATTETLEDSFPGGEVKQYALEDGGVELTDGQLSEEIIAEIDSVRQQIISGEIEVPEFSYSQEEEE